MKHQTKKKHHYIPKFHLNSWKDKSGRLIVYRKVGDGNIESKNKHPSQVCFENELYTIKKDLLGAQVSMPDYVENELAKIDSDAAKVIKKILATSSFSLLTAEDKKSWAVYVNSLLNRSPDKIKALDEMMRSIVTKTLDENQAIGTKETSDTWELCGKIINDSRFSENRARVMLLSVIRHTEWVTSLLKFKWQIIKLDKAFPYQLILTENPVVTFGEDDNIGMIALALTPSLLWAAVPDSFNNSAELDDIVKRLVLIYNGAQIAKKPIFIISKIMLKNDGFHKYDKIFSDFVKVSVGPNTTT